METTMTADRLFWLDGNRGIYIPRDFARMFHDRPQYVEGVTDEDFAILQAGPDGELYWEVWDDVLNNAVITDVNGAKYTLEQEDGDLWLVPVEIIVTGVR